MEDARDEKLSEDPPRAPGAVLAMAIAVVSVMTSELMPIGVLTPIAHDLGITPGMAGQAITATAGAALITSFLISAIIRQFDRRNVLLFTSVIIIVADLIIATAPNFAILLLARLLLGVAHGTLWSMVAATAMRLAPAPLIPRTVSVIMRGVPIAVMIASPLASFVGNVMGWRAAFFLAAGLAGFTLVFQIATLPSIPPRGQTQVRTMLRLMNRPQVVIGLVGGLLVYLGHYAFLTYTRPFLEAVPGIGARRLPIVLLVYGLFNLAAVSLSGPFVTRYLFQVLWIAPAVLGVLALVMAITGPASMAVCLLFFSWAVAYGFVPVCWHTWVTRVTPDEPESGGGLMIAFTQFGIFAGALVGGYAFDRAGTAGSFFTASGTLFLAAAIVFIVVRLWHGAETSVIEGEVEKAAENAPTRGMRLTADVAAV